MKFFAFCLFLVTIEMTVIKTSPKKEKPERQLSVFPSYNEVIDEQEYGNNLKEILGRIK